MPPAASGAAHGRHRLPVPRIACVGLIRLTFRFRADLGRSEANGLDVTSFSHDEEEVRRVNTVLDDARSAELGSASRISDASARASAEPPTHEALLSATRAASQRRLTTGQGVRPNFMRHTMVGHALQRFASEYFDDQRRR